ncbi:MAG: DUF115 domain-containing protein [Treponema sp.]|nr:DUF115 domain-containing protein [Treponema sp.]
MNGILQRNLLALSATDPDLAARISKATPDPKLRAEPSRTGLPIPILRGPSGDLALHSRMDPLREAERLAAAYPSGGFIVYLGLGAGYGIRALLDRPTTGGVLVVEYSLDLLRAILEQFDLAPVLSDRRVRLLADPDEPTLERAIFEAYIPILAGDLSTVPLRARVDADPGRFSEAVDAVRRVISRVSDDYSVQAFFGRRWFSNTVRNLYAAERPVRPLTPVREAIVTAAGPSLDELAPELGQVRRGRFLIATDTSMGALLARGIVPDAVVSIDCQHISYYHFLTPVPGEIPLILDLASPPSVARRARRVHFFSSGHPFCRYVSSHFRPFPSLDTSGGNVTHAAVSLADTLGARRIFLYGADFSYPRGASYARGTYIHRYFRLRAGRTSPQESLFSAFLYRNLQVDRETDPDGTFRYVTKPLQAYRRRLEAFAAGLSGQLVPVRGSGVDIRVPIRTFDPSGSGRGLAVFAPGKATCTAREFLESYRDGLRGLPELTAPSLRTLRSLSPEQQDLWTTLLPAAAALRKDLGNLQIPPSELMERIRAWTLEVVSAELEAGPKAPMESFTITRT